MYATAFRRLASKRAFGLTAAASGAASWLLSSRRRRAFADEGLASEPPTFISSYARTVVIAVDPSESSSFAFEWALRNVLRSDDRVVILSACSLPVYTPRGQPMHEASADVQQYIAADALHQCRTASRKFISHCQSQQIDCTAVFEFGDPRKLIPQTAARVGADMVVVGSRSFGALARVFVGSVSEYASQHCACPVVVVRNPQHGDARKPLRMEESFRFATDSPMSMEEQEGEFDFSVSRKELKEHVADWPLFMHFPSESKREKEFSPNKMAVVIEDSPLFYHSQSDAGQPKHKLSMDHVAEVIEDSPIFFSHGSASSDGRHKFSKEALADIIRDSPLFCNESEQNFSKDV